jgi:hypothetical protein
LRQSLTSGLLLLHGPAASWAVREPRINLFQILKFPPKFTCTPQSKNPPNYEKFQKIPHFFQSELSNQIQRAASQRTVTLQLMYDSKKISKKIGEE